MRKPHRRSRLTGTGVVLFLQRSQVSPQNCLALIAYCILEKISTSLGFRQFWSSLSCILIFISFDLAFAHLYEYLLTVYVISLLN